MNCIQRQDLIEAITDLCERYPGWRFGQLIANIAGWSDAEIRDVEDHHLLDAAKRHLEAISTRQPEPAAGG